MTNHEARYRMMQYLAHDYSCTADDFLQDTNRVNLSPSESDEFFRMMCFGNAAVARVNAEIYGWCKDFVSKYTGFRCFDGVEMSYICRQLAKHDYTVSCGQGALPDMNLVQKSGDSRFDMRVFKKEEIASFYSDEIDSEQWHMLYYSDDTEYIVACYDKDKVTGFAAADKHTRDIYDVGYETLPNYRQQGIATALTTQLTHILLSQDILPFATFAWSNIASKNVLIKSGYVMAFSKMISCEKDWAAKVLKGEAE